MLPRSGARRAVARERASVGVGMAVGLGMKKRLLIGECALRGGVGALVEVSLQHAAHPHVEKSTESDKARCHSGTVGCC